MNKKFISLISVLTFSLIFVFSFVNISNATLGDFVAVIAVENVKSTVVTLDISGLDPNISNYSVFLSTASKADIVKIIYSDSKGLATVSFSDLIPETKYTVGLSYIDNGVKNSRTNLASFKTSIAKVKITSFYPTEGKVGDLITIKGQDLFGVTKILFGATESEVESISSREEITTKVPPTAVDGFITVKTLDYGDAVSASKFKVFYNASLVVENSGISENSVSLKAVNLIPDEHYTVYIADKDKNFKINNDHVAIYSDSKATTAFWAVFNNLLRGHNYIAVITLDSDAITIDWNANNIPSSISFTTKGGTSGGEESIIVDNVTTTSADIIVSGLGQGRDEVCIYKDTKATSNIICDKKSGGITYSLDPNNKVTGMTKYTGKVHIDGLVAGTKYIAGLVKNGDMNTMLVRTPFTTATTVTDKAKAAADTTSVGWSGLVPKCNVGAIDTTTGQYVHPCDFNYFMALLNGLIKFLLFVIATPMVALIIMYTGYLYLTAGGSAGQTEKARHILFNVVIGYIIALAAWLVVNTIITSLKVDPTINTFLEKSSLQK